MMPKAKTAILDYTTTSAELGEVLTRLQQSDIQIDEAVELYEKGLKLVNQLEAHLQAAENKVQQLKLQYPSSEV
jgi:exodeoxyribonuclease VII small subunit